MRLLVIGLVVGVVITGAGVRAQQPAASAPPAMKLFASSADVTAMIAKAKAERKPDQANFIQPILQLAPFNANLEYRALVGGAASHDRDAELFYVIEGAGTLVTGGTLVMPTRPNPDNRNGTSIQGGMSRHVAKGDFVLVPENTPHWFSTIEGGPLVLMSLHLPR